MVMDQFQPPAGMSRHALVPLVGPLKRTNAGITLVGAPCNARACLVGGGRTGKGWSYRGPVRL